MAPKKAQKMALGDFLNDQSLGSWADEMEDMPLGESRPAFSDRRAVSSATGYDRSSPFDRGDRGDRYPREQLPLPTKPPYTAHLGNLPFDAKEVDIEDFFKNCNVTSVRIVTDKLDQRPKGFGYVEFSTLDGLKKALDLNAEQFLGRSIKISVADPPKDRGDARELTDWTRKGPLPDLPQSQRRASDRPGFKAYGDAPEMERGGSRRGTPQFEGDGKSRDFGNWERKGPLSPLPNEPQRGGEGRVRGPPRERKPSPSWGEGQSQEGSRPPRGEIRERPAVERQPTAADLDTEWRARMRPDAPSKSNASTPNPSTPSSPAPRAAVPVARPRLNLQKRTVSEADPGSGTGSPEASSIFGGARPIDTATREKEVAEKREEAVRHKREADEKIKEEKKAQEVAAKAAAEKSQEEEKTGESADAELTPSKSYTILTKQKEEGNGATEEPQAEKSEKPEKSEKSREGRSNGRSQEDKPRGPPRGAPRDAPKAPRSYNQNSWRGGRKGSNSNPSSPATPAAQEEDDGWSTVPAKGRVQRGRGGQAPLRGSAN